MRAKVEAELDCMLRDKVTLPVKHVERSTLIVPGIKPNNSVVLCGDYKLTVFVSKM